MSKDVVLVAAGLHDCLPSLGAAKQFVSKGERSTREAGNRRCVGVAKELVKCSCSKQDALDPHPTGFLLGL